MADNYYDDSADEQADVTHPPESEAKSDPAEDTEESGDEQTFVLPKAIAGGQSLKPGDRMEVEIVADHEDSYEVRKCDGESKDEASTEEPESPMPMKGGMDSFME
jgi:hypothetical protein